jgi:regulator of protease activity HflC (stomatin/prohibitin superfamily)
MNQETKYGIAVAAGVVLLMCVYFFFGPIYSVWSSGKEGQAQLAKASYNRQVAVLEARAKMEAAVLLSEADSLRAIGVAASNRIIAASISEQYLSWKWIDEISHTSNQIIYVPAGQLGLPILEANRFNKPQITQP